MKILIVDQFKAVGRDTLALANLINDDNIQMTVYLSDKTEIPKEREYSVRIEKGFHGTYEGNAINKVKTYLRSLCELKKFLKKEHFDIVHLQWFSIPWIEWIYIKSIRKYSKIVITVHDVIPFDNRPLEMRALDIIYRNADRLLIHTEKAQEEFKKHYKANTEISVMTQAFCYKPDYIIVDKSVARDKLTIPSDAIVFLYYGTIRPSKGLDTLMKAIAMAQMKNKKVYLLAAGAFHKVDENYYRQLADSLINVGAKISFGFVPYEMEKYYFSAADTLVLPYTEGTQSGVAQLGLMYELPLIASDIYCMDEVAQKNINAFRFKRGDVNELSECICKLAESSSLRKKFSQGSKIIGESNFSLENKAKKVKMAYTKTLIDK